MASIACVLVARVYRTGRELSLPCLPKQRNIVIADVCLRVSESCCCCMPTTRHPPFTALYAISIPGAARHTEGAQLSVAARSRQANRCSPRAYLIPRDPAGHYPNPSFARALSIRDPVPDTEHPSRCLLALGPEVKGLDDCAICPPCSRHNKRRPHAHTKRVESQPRPRWSLAAAEALRLSLCYLWS